MVTKRKMIVLLFILVAGLIVIFISFWMKGKRGRIIEVEGFEIEYNLPSRKITMEDLDNIKLGSSINEITNKLGEPDTWIGSGMLLLHSGILRSREMNGMSWSRVCFIKRILDNDKEKCNVT